MIHKIVDNFYFIERGWLNANHFVFSGEKKVLIDTGYLRGFDQTKRLVESLGMELAAVDLIISTHSHSDHIGGNRRIREESGCQIAMHRIDKGFINSRDDWATWYRFYDHEAEFFSVDVSLEDGDILKLDGLELQVVHTPGHARGGICLYCQKGRWLISSDAMWDGDLGVINTIIEGLDAPHVALKSLEKLTSLDIDIVYPGHGGMFHNHRTAIEKCKRKLEEFIKHPARLGNDHLRKILIWTLLMKKGCPEDDFFPYLMRGLWFRAVIDVYFESRYREKFDELMEDFLRRKIIYVADGYYRTSINP